MNTEERGKQGKYENINKRGKCHSTYYVRLIHSSRPKLMLYNHLYCNIPGQLINIHNQVNMVSQE